MPKQKDLKRRVRVRMDKTGESYTTARAHLLRKKSPSLPDNYQELAGMSDEAVAAKTGKNWREWVAALDAIDATGMTHTDIARRVNEQTGLDWWSQTVTVGYERIRGLREIGQRRSGSYEASRSRTFPVPVEQLFDAFADAKRRRRWLTDEVTIRKATPHKSVRITWNDGSDVVAYLTAKGAAKSSVAITHAKLPSRKAADAAKALWTERLDALGALLK
jgi:uncharacterized protein YndB with AHSA1/START domain